jgi:hypothetical protein
VTVDKECRGRVCGSGRKQTRYGRIEGVLFSVRVRAETGVQQ